MTVVDTLLVGYHLPRIVRDLYAISALAGGGAISPLGISHIKPLPQRYSESTKLLKFSSVEHQLQPP